MRKPGWYPDPSGRYELRWFNGEAWTADVARAGERLIDRPGPTAAAGRPATNPLATAALVCGVTAAALGVLIVLFPIAGVLGVLGVIFGFVGRRRAGQAGVGRPQAVAGLVGGAVGMVLAVIGGVLTFGPLMDTLERINDSVFVEAHSESITSCTVDGGRAIAEGTVRNDGDERQRYEVHVEFRDPESERMVARDSVELERLEPGAEATFRATARVGPTEVECVITRVSGPDPFG